VAATRTHRLAGVVRTVPLRRLWIRRQQIVSKMLTTKPVASTRRFWYPVPVSDRGGEESYESRRRQCSLVATRSTTPPGHGHASMCRAQSGVDRGVICKNHTPLLVVFAAVQIGFSARRKRSGISASPHALSRHLQLDRARANRDLWILMRYLRGGRPINRMLTGWEIDRNRLASAGANRYYTTHCETDMSQK
jgi:hypothetical protein